MNPNGILQLSTKQAKAKMKDNAETSGTHLDVEHSQVSQDPVLDEYDTNKEVKVKRSIARSSMAR